MKNVLSKTGLKVIVCLFLLTISVMYACRKDSKDVLKTNYDAEELFRSLVLLKGSLVNSIPELQDMSAEVNKSGSKYSQADVSRINEIVSGLKQYYPAFLESFKKEVTSHDPVKVEKAMLEASNKTINVIFLNKFSAKLPNEARQSFLATVMAHPDELNEMINERATNKISNSELRGKILDLFGLKGKILEGAVPGFLNKSSSVNSQETASEGDCLVVVFEVVFLVNVYAGVNIEFELNIHQIQNFHTYKNVKVEFSSPAVSSLTKERLYAAIAENL